jgi:aromatic-L-amino-acid decarboxylase
MELEEFRRAAHAVIDRIVKYRQDLEARALPVQPRVEPGEIARALPLAAPEAPEGLPSILGDLDSLIFDGVMHWQHPRFFGYFPSGGGLASVLGDIISTGLGGVGLSWQSSPALTEVETVMMSWMRELLGLSSAWSGVIQDTASTATLVALLCARERTTGYSAAHGGLQGEAAPLVVYTTSEAHSSVLKAAALAGFGRDNVRTVETDELLAMRAEALDEHIRADRAAGRRPCAVVATVGTTNTTAIDPVQAIAEVAGRENVWLHVDAALGGAAMLAPEYRVLWQGVEQADSIVVNAHKWMSVALDCSLYYVRDPEHLVRVMSTNPSYLRTDVDTEVVNYRDWGIPLGRRFRALKLWLTLRTVGAEALRARIRRDCGNARWLADQVDAAAGWRRLAPVPLQTVCVLHEPSDRGGEALDRHTLDWCRRINASGFAYLTPSVLAGRWFVRVSVGTELTEREDVAALWAIMRTTAEECARA